MKKFKKQTLKKSLLCVIAIFSLSCTSIFFANANSTTAVDKLIQKIGEPKNKTFETITFNNVTYIYSVSDFGTAEIQKVITDAEVIDVPEIIDGKKITYLEGLSDEKGETVSPFSYSKNLKTITLPDSIKSFGNRAFYGCKSLEKIVLPTDLHFVFGEEVFKNCRKLKYICIKHNSTCVEIKNQQDLYRAFLLNIVDLNKTVVFKNNLI